MIETKFLIQIKEVLSRTVTVQANNLQEAIAKAEAMYVNEEVVLDCDDLEELSFEEVKL